MTEQRNTSGLKLIGMKIILTLIFLCYTNALNAQNRKIDSLKVILRHSKEDTFKVKLLCDLANEYYHIDIIQSTSYAKEGISLAEKLNWKKGEIMGGVCLMFNQTADRYFSDAISSGLKILRMAEAENDTSSLIQIYNRLGATYRVMFQYELSEEYQMKALLIARKYNNELKLLKVLVSLNVLYTEAKQFDKAEKYAAEALPMAIRLKDDDVRLLIQQMSAERKYASGNIREAVTLYSQIIESRKAMKHHQIVAYMEGTLGTFYADLQMKDSAFYFVNAALELSKREHLTKELNDSYQFLYYVSKTFHDYENALKYHLIADSLDKAGYTSDVMMKTERERLLLQEKKDALTNAEIQKQKTVRNFTFAGALGLLAFGGYAFYNYRRRRRFEKQQALSEERLRISRDLHDDMGASLSSISVFSSAVKQKLVNNETQEAEQLLDRMSTDAQEMVSGMSEMVWTISPHNDTIEKLTDRLQLYAAGMLSAKNISFSLECDEELKNKKLTVDFRKNVFLILKEAINNAAKYSNATEVKLTVSKKENRFVAVLADNGKGFDISAPGTGNGLNNMRHRADEIQSQIEINSEINKGTSVTFLCLLPKIGEK